jgi:hypothetical protein
MIAAIRDGGINRITLLCDVCDQEITDSAMALARWEHKPGRKIAECSVVHKGDCDRALTRRNGEGGLWDELDAALIYIGNNVEHDPKRGLRIARFVQRMNAGGRP